MKSTPKENDVDLDKIADTSPEHVDDEGTGSMQDKASPEHDQDAGGMEDKLEERRHEIVEIDNQSLEGDTIVRVISVTVENTDDIRHQGVRAGTIVAGNTTFEGGTLVKVNSPDYSEALLDGGTPVTPVESPWSLLSPVQ